MITQHEWVEGCYAYYAENGYEPGNPEDGEWEDAHYPVPKCEGGEVTIKLLKQHHAIQGVLQSEEYQRPCIWGWEANYLEGEMLALCNKWKSEMGRRWHATMTPEQRSERSRKARLTQLANMGQQARSELSRKARAKQLATTTPEQRSEIARLRQAALTPEQRREAARKAAATRLANETPEQRRARALKAAATQRRNREAAMLRSVTTP